MTEDITRRLRESVSKLKNSEEAQIVAYEAANAIKRLRLIGDTLVQAIEGDDKDAVADATARWKKFRGHDGD